MKNKGFTLIELLGSIVILAIIALVAFPAILGLLNNSQTKIDSSMQELMISATRKYINDRTDEYPLQISSVSTIKTYTNGNITGKTLLDSGYLDANIVNSNKNCGMLNDYVQVTSNSQTYLYSYKTVAGGC